MVVNNKKVLFNNPLYTKYELNFIRDEKLDDDLCLNHFFQRKYIR